MSDNVLVTLARRAMGTRFEIALWGVDPVALRSVGEEALDEVARLDRQLSVFNPASDLSALNARAARGPVVLEPELFGLFWEARSLSEATAGAFDLTVGPLMQCWGLRSGEGRLPTPEELAAARDCVGMDRVLFDQPARSVRFTREGVQLDLGAIGKGYAIDQAVQVLRDAGVQSALVHGGTSTSYGIGAPPDEEGWRVAIQHPTSADTHVDVVSLRDQALSVSAGHGKSFTREGRTYGHVIDPRTGEPVADGPLLAAVIGPSATVADAFSTALLVLGEPGLNRVAEHPGGYGGLIVRGDGTKCSRRWKGED